MTGRNLFPPKYSLGYSGSSMAYTDDDKAQEKLKEFILNCDKHDIMCDFFQLSSGYTSKNGKRYVF